MESGLLGADITSGQVYRVPPSHAAVTVCIYLQLHCWISAFSVKYIAFPGKNN